MASARPRASRDFIRFMAVSSVSRRKAPNGPPVSPVFVQSSRSPAPLKTGPAGGWIPFYYNPKPTGLQAGRKKQPLPTPVRGQKRLLTVQNQPLTAEWKTPAGGSLRRSAGKRAPHPRPSCRWPPTPRTAPITVTTVRPVFGSWAPDGRRSAAPAQCRAGCPSGGWRSSDRNGRV